MTQPPTTPEPDEPVEVRPAAYDPSQSYVVYQAAQPPAYLQGFGIPLSTAQAGFDPMISPDYNGWWQRSTTIFKGAWRQLAILQLIGFVLTLVVVIPEGIWSLKVTADFIDAANASEATPSLTPLVAPFALLFLGTVVAGMVGSMITVAGNQIAVTVAAGQPPRLGPAFALAVRRFLPLWGWSLLSALMMLVGFCLCILPGIYLYAVFLILPAVVTFERGSGAIARCFQLVHRDFGAAIARIATIIGLTLLVGLVSYFVGQIIERTMGGVPESTLGSTSTGAQRFTITTTAIVTIAVSRLVTTLLETAMKLFTDVLTVTAYADMRAGLDPQLTTAHLAAEAGVPVAPAAQWTAPPPAAA
ncbi:hypothetical protein Dvina_09260 [Dactylosporangium vinaceum]|uniref:Integral membrane protein n=1 Tax=Dactylosporangium vinaceum TaxID=53362 RepID=A0ABV5LYL3_9ACTN|nr:hypothetical protein [Dactylosporangium vinaceum]UAB98250.1 hypothetical protein Dvina_09260 [Dactylosporangium vinaceum]